MKNFALALLLTALAGCGSSSSPSVQTPVEPTENNTGFEDLVCFIFSLFNPACFDRDGVVVPTDPENLTPQIESGPAQSIPVPNVSSSTSIQHNPSSGAQKVILIPPHMKPSGQSGSDSLHPCTHALSSPIVAQTKPSGH